MTTTQRPISEPARIAAPDEGISQDELALAGRNHALPLEALRHDLTPPGLHYVLVHYDVPDVDAATWTLEVGGEVSRQLSLDLDALRAYPAVTLPVTLECAGNGRAHLMPRPVSQPWLEGAVGTAAWTGARLADVLDDAGLTDRAVDVVLTGADHGIERSRQPWSGRSAPNAWGRWTFTWQAAPGDHELCVRAGDDTGEVQPLQPPWNAQGMANNAVQRVAVHVR